MITDTPDALLRTARRLAEIHDHQTAIDLKPGFTFRGAHPAHQRPVLSAGRRRRSAGNLYMRIDLKRQGYNAADQGAAA